MPVTAQTHVVRFEGGPLDKQYRIALSRVPDKIRLTYDGEVEAVYEYAGPKEQTRDVWRYDPQRKTNERRRIIEATFHVFKPVADN